MAPLRQNGLGWCLRIAVDAPCRPRRQARSYVEEGPYEQGSRASFHGSTQLPERHRPRCRRRRRGRTRRLCAGFPERRGRRRVSGLVHGVGCCGGRGARRHRCGHHLRRGLARHHARDRRRPGDGNGRCGYRRAGRRPCRMPGRVVRFPSRRQGGGGGGANRGRVRVLRRRHLRLQFPVGDRTRLRRLRSGRHHGRVLPPRPRSRVPWGGQAVRREFWRDVRQHGVHHARYHRHARSRRRALHHPDRLRQRQGQRLPHRAVPATRLGQPRCRPSRR